MPRQEAGLDCRRVDDNSGVEAPDLGVQVRDEGDRAVVAHLRDGPDGAAGSDHRVVEHLHLGEDRHAADIRAVATAEVTDVEPILDAVEPRVPAAQAIVRGGVEEVATKDEAVCRDSKRVADASLITVPMSTFGSRGSPYDHCFVF